MMESMAHVVGSIKHKTAALQAHTAACLSGNNSGWRAAAAVRRRHTHMATAFHFLISKRLPLVLALPFFSSTACACSTCVRACRAAQ